MRALRAATLSLMAASLLGGCCAVTELGRMAIGRSQKKTPGMTQAAGTQSRCPITGEPVNRDLFVDHAGKRIYVCCAGCLAEVSRNPEKYVRELESQGITLAPAEKIELGTHQGHDPAPACKMCH